MTYQVHVLVLAYALCLPYVLSVPHSCMDVYKSNEQLSSGEYTINNQHNQPYKVYCQFHKGYGYTYISKDTNVDININDLYTSTSHFRARIGRSNGDQLESTLQQMRNFRQHPVSFQYNAFTNYTSPVNAKMTPFVYAGFIPSVMSHRGQTEGYSVNGVDEKFVNCDGNPNSYIVFLFNHNNVAVTPYNPSSSVLVHDWVDRAANVAVADKIPASYFSFFEIHQGGCGGFAVTSHFPNVVGASIGLRFDIACPDLSDIANGSKSGGGTAVGSVAQFTCDLGYAMLSGDAQRRCLDNGVYSGVQPVCGAKPCSSDLCQNGGSCYTLEDGRFSCVCPVGYVGTVCETQIV